MLFSAFWQFKNISEIFYFIFNFFSNVYFVFAPQVAFSTEYQRRLDTVFERNEIWHFTMLLK